MGTNCAPLVADSFYTATLEMYSLNHDNQADVIEAFKKVQVGKDQEKAQSAKDSHSKNPRWEKPN